MGTITERQRQRFGQWADQHMDDETVDMFMASTPPAGWGDVATKQDLDVLETRLSAKLAEAIGGVHQEMGKRGRAEKWQTVTLLVAILVAMLGNTVLPHYFPPPAPAPASAAPIVIQVPPQ